MRPLLDRAPEEVERLTREASYLVRFLARRHLGHGLDIDDLVAAGNLGLVQAAYKFDERRGLRFATYAAWWIRKEIAETLQRERSTIRVPRYALELRRRLGVRGTTGLSPLQAR